MAEYDLLIRYTGELASEVTGFDALLFTYDRIGYNKLGGGTVGFAGEFLDGRYNQAAGFAAGLMGSDEGIIVKDGKGRIEITYDLDGLEALVLRESDNRVIPVKKCRDILIDIAVTGVIYENISDTLKSAVVSGEGVCSPVYLTTGKGSSNETTGSKDTYNIISDFEGPEGITSLAAYDELYIASQETVIASAIYGCVSSAKRLY